MTMYNYLYIEITEEGGGREGGIRGVWLSSLEMDSKTQVQILDETDCISHSANTLKKGINPIILLPAIRK